MRVGVTAPVNGATGFVVDYIDLKSLVQPLVDTWDHSFLGAIKELRSMENDSYGLVVTPSFPGYPSSENLVMYVVDWLRPLISTIPGTIEGDVASLPELTLVEIEETCTSRCTWRLPKVHH